MVSGAFAARVRAPLRAFALFLVLDAPVLEPDLHLFLRQVEVRSDLNPAQARQVHVGGELALELEELRAGEGRAHALSVLNVAVL